MTYTFNVTKQNNEYIAESRQFTFRSETKERLLAKIRQELGNYACHRRKNKWILNDNISLSIDEPMK